MAFARTLLILFGIWGVLLGIGFAAGALPPPPAARTASAADYGGGDLDDSEDADPSATTGSATQMTATAADYGAMGGTRMGGSAMTATAADYAGAMRGGGTASANDYFHPEDDPTSEYAGAYSGRWSEATECEELADVDDLRASRDKRAALLELARRRYPPGVPFIEALNDDALNTFVQGDDFTAWASSFEVAVHEGSHLWSGRHIQMRGRHPSFRYNLTADVEYSLPHGDTPARGDLVPSLRGPADDTYRPIYLEGSSGEQGFNTLLDETNAYIHGLAASTCIRDLYGRNGRRSSRDGVVAMLLYVGTYLALLEREHATVYARLKASDAWRGMVADLDERAKYWLAKARDFPRLGVRDDAYLAELERPAVLGAIRRFVAESP